MNRPTTPSAAPATDRSRCAMLPWLAPWLALTLTLALAQSPLTAQESQPNRPDSAEAATPTIDQNDQDDSTTDDSTTEDSTTEDNTLRIYDEVEVRERADDLRGIAISAAEGSTGRRELALRPILRPGELIETTPGVIATQHSGGGKANQFFVRGFNLDHGTDFSARVAGVPVNLPSHGHGQGYADLNFLIPELVDRVRYRKGPYFADVGDFSAAGSVDIGIVRELPDSLLELTGGTNDAGRLLWTDQADVGSGERGPGRLLGGVEVFRDDGPWVRDQSFDGAKGLLRYSSGDAADLFDVTLMAYTAGWLSTDQVPRRAVESGLIDRFGLIDPGPRGASDRVSLSTRWTRGDDRELTEIGAYLLWSDFDLISNFTYFLEDPVDGDQFEQIDRRWVAGLDLERSWLSSWGDRRVETRAGVDGRYDAIENGLFRTRDLERTSTVRADEIDLAHAGAWTDATIDWSDRWRARVGVRGDFVAADVTSDLAANSGSTTDWLISPKASIVHVPSRTTELSLNLGYGYHSNDARGAVISVDPITLERVDPVEPLVRAKGADLGVRWVPRAGAQTTFTVFVLELDSELVFVGDGGATEASRPSRRVGVEWTNVVPLDRIFPDRLLALDFDVTLTDARFTDDAPEGDEIPGAIGTTIAAGLTADNLLTLSNGARLFGSLRWRYFGDVPLVEDGSAEWDSTSLVNARIGYRFGGGSGLALALDVFNLLDADDSDIEYFYASRLPGEPVQGIEDVHFHPVESRSARLSLSWRR